MFSPIKRAVALALTLGALVGCAPDTGATRDASITPTGAANADVVGGLLSSLLYVNGLQRTSPLASAVTVTKVIGGDGGTIGIPSAGVTVVIPRGALVAPTTISMTARAGSLVAYDFSPHGVTFARPLSFTQSLNGTNASAITALTLKLGYYSDPSFLSATGGLVSQLIGGTLDLLGWKFNAPISHFSGYIVSTGRQ